MRRAAIFLLACACSSGEISVYTVPIEPDAGADAGEPCQTHYCLDSYVICQYCICPGEPCRHVDYATDAVIAEGVCLENLTCSVPCPSPTGDCPP